MFAAQTKEDVPVTYEEIKDLQAKIYKLFLQVIISLAEKDANTFTTTGNKKWKKKSAAVVLFHADVY